MKIQFEVKPKDKTPVGWDCTIMSWNPEGTALKIHRVIWSEETQGVFVGVTGNLPLGEYLIRVELFGPGREVDVEVRGNAPVTQPAGKSWPMTVKVDGGTQTQNSETWYFGNSK